MDTDVHLGPLKMLTRVSKRHLLTIDYNYDFGNQYYVILINKRIKFVN